MKDKYKLPKEININVGADEMKGEYICKRCKGWGYINYRGRSMGGLTSPPINICPECRGGGIIDWAKRPRHN